MSDSSDSGFAWEFHSSQGFCDPWHRNARFEASLLQWDKVERGSRLENLGRNLEYLTVTSNEMTHTKRPTLRSHHVKVDVYYGAIYSNEYTYAAYAHLIIFPDNFFHLDWSLRCIGSDLLCVNLHDP